MPEKNDIENREDIMYLIRSFYTQAMQDELIGTFFTEVVVINLEEHLPIMGDFWENLLFHTGAYHGGMMQKHFRINSKKISKRNILRAGLNYLRQKLINILWGPWQKRLKVEQKRLHAQCI